MRVVNVQASPLNEVHLIVSGDGAFKHAIGHVAMDTGTGVI